jgi:hypothetical protein
VERDVSGLGRQCSRQRALQQLARSGVGTVNGREQACLACANGKLGLCCVLTTASLLPIANICLLPYIFCSWEGQERPSDN